MFLGDDFHHNGAFRLSYGFEYAFMEEASKTDTLFPFDAYDTYDWYLRLGALSNVASHYPQDTLPTWRNFVSHPDYDSFWKGQALAGRNLRANVPILHVAGWWDQEDASGPLKAYELFERNDTAHRNFLVAGPWNHGGMNWGAGKSLGEIQFGDSTSSFFRDSIEARWFARHLKGKGSLDLPEALTFQTGSNRWIRRSAWPPKDGIVRKHLYFHERKTLSFVPPPPGGTSNFDEFVSDPAHPVPYRSRPIEPTYGPDSRWYTWLVEDQRFVEGRPDVLSWTSDTLKEDCAVSGSVLARLFVSTSATDCDWVVKLIDVYPEKYPEDPKMGGYQLMIAADVTRSRFRHGFEHPEPMIPGQVDEVTVDLLAHDHLFQRGHRLMVQVQSTWFPIIDRNPQKFVENIFKARDTDFRSASHRVYRDREHASRIELPTLVQP